jgi:hypothetical protein
MPLELPDLQGTNLSRLRLTFYRRNPDPALTNWIPSVGRAHAAELGNGLWLHDEYYSFISAINERVVVVTISIERDGINPNIETPQPVGVIQERFSQIADQDVVIRFEAVHMTQKDKIPKGGKIDAFIGVSSGVDRIGLDLSGVKMRVRGSVIGEFEWVLKDIPLDDKPVTFVESNLEAWFFGQKAAEQSLVNAAKLASDAYRFFVLDEAPADAICVSDK